MTSLPMLKARTTWIALHRYLGLSLGALFVLVGLSGSLSLFARDIDQLLNPQLRIREPNSPPLSMDRIMGAVKAAHPDRYGAWTLELAETPSDVVTAWYESPRETTGKLYAPLMVSVNPYSGVVLASRFWGETAATRLLDLHTQLGLGGLGWNLVGMLGAALPISAVSGLLLWWPGWTGLSRAFSLRTHRLIALSFDLHRLSGWLLAVPLLVLALTGMALAFPRLPEAVLGAPGMEHGAGGPEYRSTGTQNDHPVGIAEAALIARGPFPRAELRRITLPAHENGTYRVTLRQRTEINQRHPYTSVWVDRWSGQIREVRNPSRFSGGESAMAALWPVHTGEAWGWFGKSVWFLTGLVPLFLYVSGLMRWLNRRGWLEDRVLDLRGLRQRAVRHMARAAAQGLGYGRAACRASLLLLAVARGKLQEFRSKGP